MALNLNTLATSLSWTAQLAALPLIARTLGNRMGVSVTIGGSQAYTNGKTINLPVPDHLGSTDDIERYLRMLHGYLDHEAAHIRYTDFKAVSKHMTAITKKWEKTKEPPPYSMEVLHLLTNVLEDIRIEHLLPLEYPGTRPHLLRLANLLATDVVLAHFDSMPTSQPLMLVISTIHVTLRTDVLGNDMAKIKDYLQALALPLLGDKLFKQVLDAAAVCHKDADTVRVAERAARILNLLAQLKAAPAQSQQGQEGKQEAASQQGEAKATNGGGGSAKKGPKPETDGKAADPDKGPGTKSKSNDDKAGATEAAEEGTDEDGSAGQDAQGDADEIEAGGAGQDATDAPNGAGSGAGSFGAETSLLQQQLTSPDPQGTDARSIATDIAAACQAALEAVDAHINSVNTIPSMIVEARQSFESAALLARRTDYQPVSMSAAGRLDGSLRRKLVTALESALEARTHSQEFSGTSGNRLISRKLAGTRAGDFSVFVKTEEGEEFSTAIGILIDHSGSMQGQRLTQAYEAAASLAEAIHLLNKTGATGEAGLDLAILGFTTSPSWVLKFGEQWSTTPANRLASLAARGGTKYSPALLALSEHLLNLDKDRKILVIITDGEPEDRGPMLEGLCEFLKKADIEVVAIGISMYNRGEAALKELFGPKAVLSIKDSNLKQLPGLLAKTLADRIH